MSEEGGSQSKAGYQASSSGLSGKYGQNQANKKGGTFSLQQLQAIQMFQKRSIRLPGFHVDIRLPSEDQPKPDEDHTDVIQEAPKLPGLHVDHPDIQLPSEDQPKTDDEHTDVMPGNKKEIRVNEELKESQADKKQDIEAGQVQKEQRAKKIHGEEEQDEMQLNEDDHEEEEDADIFKSVFSDTDEEEEDRSSSSASLDELLRNLPRRSSSRRPESLDEETDDEKEEQVKNAAKRKLHFETEESRGNVQGTQKAHTSRSPKIRKGSNNARSLLEQPSGRSTFDVPFKIITEEDNDPTYEPGKTWVWKPTKTITRLARLDPAKKEKLKLWKEEAAKKRRAQKQTKKRRRPSNAVNTETGIEREEEQTDQNSRQPIATEEVDLMPGTRIGRTQEAHDQPVASVKQGRKHSASPSNENAKPNQTKLKQVKSSSKKNAASLSSSESFGQVAASATSDTDHPIIPAPSADHSNRPLVTGAQITEQQVFLSEGADGTTGDNDYHSSSAPPTRIEPTSGGVNDVGLSTARLSNVQPGMHQTSLWKMTSLPNGGMRLEPVAEGGEGSLNGSETRENFSPPDITTKRKVVYKTPDGRTVSIPRGSKLVRQ